jgi:hypothetical protein
MARDSTAVHLSQHLLLSGPRTRTRPGPAADPRDVKVGSCYFGYKDPAALLHALSHVSSAPVSRAVLCMQHPQLTGKLHIRLLEHVKLSRGAMCSDVACL